MTDAPPFFADIFERHCRRRAEVHGCGFVLIYSFGTTTSWDFAGDTADAESCLAAAWLPGMRAAVFHRANDTWRRLILQSTLEDHHDHSRI